jgi:hypothetical protein
MYCDQLFETIINNIQNQEIIDDIINILINIIDMKYDDILKNIMLYLNDSTFVMIFLNKFLINLPDYTESIIIDVIQKLNVQDVNFLDKLNNIFLLDCANHKMLFNVYQYKKLNNDEYVRILNWIVMIGKIDLIENLLQNFFIDRIRYEKIFELLTSLITFHKNINDEYIYVRMTKSMLRYMHILLPLFELTEIVNNLLHLFH